jgi:hypothetical protein
MNDLQMFWWVATGVAIAVVLPVLIGMIRQDFPATKAIGLPPWAKKYGVLLIFSLITALPCLAIWKTTNPKATLEWYTAFLLGFSWESGLEKFTKK